MATIKEIAKRAEVSRGTVDRVLHNRGGVNAKVAQKVLKVAKEMGYTPNRVGRALANAKKTIKIGALLSSVGNEFFSPLIEGITAAEKEYSDFGLKVELKEIEGFSAKKQAEIIEEFVRDEVSGVLLTPVNNPEIIGMVNSLEENGIPTVAVNSDIAANRIAYVGCDYENSGKTAAGLIGLFCEEGDEIIIISGSSKILGHTLRVKGFENEVDKELCIAKIIECEDNDKLAYEKLNEAIKENPKARVFYFAAGGVAGGLLAIEENNFKKIPIVVTCDLTETIKSAMIKGKIQATITQRPYEQGFEAVRTLFQKIVERDSFKANDILMPNEILIKQSLD